MRQPGEPSIEEILESIKQVIAREDRGPAFRDLPADDEPEEAQEDVLDLAKGDFASQAPDGPGPLVTDDASQSMRSSLDALAGAIENNPRREPPADASSALEALLRELLRPAVADWLDRNLPAIVERMVAAEIARIAGRR